MIRKVLSDLADAMPIHPIGIALVVPRLRAKS